MSIARLVGSCPLVVSELVSGELTEEIYLSAGYGELLAREIVENCALALIERKTYLI